MDHAEIKLVDHAGAPADGGEICTRGPQMLVGYLHPEDEHESFDAEGYFRTGDLARWVDDDYLVVTGRAKDIIIRNGENISSKEVEDLLIGHPGIAEVAGAEYGRLRIGSASGTFAMNQLPGILASLREKFPNADLSVSAGTSQTLVDKMMHGGIYDQIGGGFSFRIAEQGFQILVCKRGELFVRPIDHNENFSFRIVLR